MVPVKLKLFQDRSLDNLLTSAACHNCSGEGQVVDSPCRNCSGDGRVNDEVTVKIDVPAGVEEGHYMTMRGEGNSGKRGGQPGDIIVVFQELTSRTFYQRKR